MKFFLFAVLGSMVLCAQNIEISADKFNASEILGQSEFMGNVVVKKGKDVLKAKKLLIYFDKKRKPTRYEASGNAQVDLKLDNKNYFAQGKKLTYVPDKKTYILQGNAFLHDKTTNKKVYGEYVKIDQNSGLYEVDSKGKSPVKFIFQVDDSK